MSYIHPYILQKLTSIKSLFEEHKVSKAYLFGSGVNETFNSESDIDIVINMEESDNPIETGYHHEQLWNSLEELLGRKVDLVTEKYIRNKFFLDTILKQRILIYER
jgi:predicted nucleotidyltransferase